MSTPSPFTSPAGTYHLLEWVRITGGYLRDLQIDFAAGLNCVIGGTGAGKTTLLVLILYGLGIPFPPSCAEHHEKLVAAALPTGKVIVRVRTRHGVVYESSRAYGDPAPRVTDADGRIVDVTLSDEIFQIEYHATKDIERIATDPAAQLALLDRFVEPELRPVQADMSRLVRRLEDAAREIAQLRRDVEDEEERAAELPNLVEALRGLQTPAGLDPAEARKAFEDKQRRVRERTALAYQTELCDERRKALDALARERGCFSPRLDRDVEGGPNADVFASLVAELRTIDRVDAEAVGRLSSGIDAARAAIGRATLALAARHAVADDAYDALVEREKVDKGLLSERARLEARLAEVSAVAKRQEARRRDLAALREDRGRMLGELARLRETHRALRERAVSEANDALKGRIEIELKPSENRNAYEALLVSMTAGANIRPATFLKAIAAYVRPDDLVAAVEADDAAPLIAVDPSTTPTEQRAKNVLAALRRSGRLSEIETVRLEDVPIVKLATDKGYEPVEKLSSGERCAAILPIVLLKARGPLLIDEPEQHLHNKYIYSVLVKMMGEAELAGQLVFATHNGNIVALGNAKRVFSLAGGGGHGRLVEFGTVDELRSAIVILEGGREAFERRAEKYGVTDA